MIALWLLNTDSFGIIPRPLLNLLDPQEEKQARFMRPAEQRRFLIGRIALRQGLSSVIGGDPGSWRFIIGESGKVSLAHSYGRPFAEFNISYSGNAIAIAVSTSGPVGLDLEESQSTVSSSGTKILPEEQFSAREKSYLSKLSDEARWNEALKIWTRKEAFSKLSGHGMNLDFSEIEVMDSRNPGTSEVSLETQEVSIAGKSYFLSLALRRKSMSENLNILSQNLLSCVNC